jgi:fucose permease
MSSHDALARQAIRAGFFVEGFCNGTWGAHVPSVARHYGLDEGSLSMALLCAALGALASVTQAGSLVTKWGARTVARVTGLTLCGSLALTLWPAAFVLLLPLMFIFGASVALFDVAINAEANELEARSGRKLMSGFHGMFSLGGMAAAGVVAGLIAQEVPAAWQVSALAGLMAAVVLWVAAGMDPIRPPPTPRRPYRLPRGALGLIGLLCGVAFVAEGAMYDWAALFLSQETGSSSALAAIGFSVFSAAMAVARFGGDAARERLGPQRTLVLGALLAAGAMAVALVLRHPTVALVAYALAGIGLANVVPVLFVAASRVPGGPPAEGLASVVSVGFVGFLVGPPLIGALARATSLTWALGAIVLGSLALAALARRLPR